MIIHSTKKRSYPSNSASIVKSEVVKEEKKVEIIENIVEVNEEKPIKKSKNNKFKQEEPILPIIEDDFSLIEEEYNS